MKALILAAGYGTRLSAIAKDTPKPLLKIANRPMIDHLLEKIKSLPGLDEVIVVTNSKFVSHFTKWAEQKKNNFPVPVAIVNDKSTCPEDRLGSVGDIHFVAEECALASDLLVLGGDNLFDYSLEDFLQFAVKNSPNATIGLYDIGEKERAKEFGVVGLDTQGRVASFHEKPASPLSSLVAMCFYYFPKKTLPFLEEYRRQSKNLDKAGDYIRWLVQAKGVYGFEFRGKWYDIGSVESYYEAQEKFK